jgi:hypothetical protein
MRCCQGLGRGVTRAIDPSQLLPNRAISTNNGVASGGLDIGPWLGAQLSSDVLLC